MTAECLAVLALVAAFGVEANPLKDPKRAVNGQTVDLGDLFRWWSKHDGERPLRAWVHVTGSVIETTAWGWTLNAHVEKAAAKGAPALADKDIKVLLKNPPVRELAEFENLRAQLKALNDQHARLSAQAAKTASQARALSGQEYTGQRSRLARHALGQESRASKQQAADAKEQLRPIDQSILEINTKLAAFPDHGKYIADCIALDTGQKVNGLPVYEHGVALK